MPGMIIGDITLWAAALKQQRETAFMSLVADLRYRGQITAPACVFGQLLAECGDEPTAQKIREWAMQVPEILTPPTAWLAAGDVSARLQSRGVELDLVSCLVLVACIREDAELWSFDPRMREAVKIVEARTYQAPRI